ncbi:AP-3 complex subunit delta-1-like [Ruditapes philippinarum]|uniref:AP-3 complex subunit delta-1-like n=1 Tax=Ruditapes philippinarum TaxID=129788 RepID=UPI00295BA4A5|nr:AP-3 complex subunit delta-1-like [Ruditapes philippinarum]
MALSKVKGTLERVLDKNLQDLVRGIRNHKENEHKYVAECLDEIKSELRQDNIAVKAMAVNKLTYLQMLGYDVSWAAFNVIEVMSSTKFTFKRIGYLAASQSFHDGTDVLMLTTNMIRKINRLGKKLIEPLTNLIHSTSAMSLLYECINTVIAVLISVSTGIPNHTASIQLCVQKLRILIEDSDQNLKYLGLLAMSKILQTHPKSVQTHKDLILQCLDDKDESIRFRALDLLYGMVSKKNLMEIVKKLMIHMDKAEGTNYRDELLAKIIEICSQSNYQYVTNFEWYVSILVELTRMEGTRHGRLIASQMLDVAIRVQAIRSFAVAQMAVLLENAHLLANNSQRNGICEVLYAAAWLCGEFPDELEDPKGVLEAMLKPKITALPGHIQSVYVQNSIKLYANIIKRSEEDNDTEVVKEVGEMLQEKLPIFIQSSDLEVQERACCMVQLVKYVLKLQDKGASVTGIAEEVTALFAGELNPVATKAQKKVPVPEGLDLDSWINDPPSESSDDDDRRVGNSIFLPPGGDDHRSFYSEPAQKVKEMTEEERSKARETRQAEQEHNPNYLKGDTKRKKASLVEGTSGIPVAHIDLSVPLHVPGVNSDKYMQMDAEGRKKKQKKKKRKKRKGEDNSDEEDDIPQQHQVSVVTEMPEGASNLSDKDDEGDELYKKLDINLDEPLQPNEILPVRTHRVVSDQLPSPTDEPVVKKKSKHKKEKESRKEKKKKKEERKEEKKKHKKKAHKMNGEDEPSLMMEDHEEIDGDNTPLQSPRDNAPPVVNNVDDKPIQNGDEKMNDLDFWLSGNDAKSNSKQSEEQNEEPVKVKVSHVPELSSDDEDVKTRSKKKKKEKKEKREKKDKKEKKKSKNKLTADGYEETDGITTPSKEEVSPSQLDTPVNAKPMSSYRLLAENQTVKMTCETRVSPQRTDQIVLSVVFTNLTSDHIKSLEFNVMDTLNTKLIRGIGQNTHDAVQVPFVLPAGVSNEGQFAFSVQSIVQPSKMKGTLTYMVKTEEGSTHDKLDFRLEIPCSAFFVALPCKGPDFASLLGSGDLTEKSTLKCTPLDPSFDVSLLRICFFNHFKVVEKVDNSASLYSRSIQGHHVCLLVKNNGGELTVDGKCSESSLLSNLLDDIKTTLTSDIL